MLLRNTAAHTLNVWGTLVEPGGTLEIADGYCLSSVAPNGDRLRSTVEQRWPALRPVNPEDAVRMRTKPSEQQPEPTLEEKEQGLISDGVAPNVAALVASGQVEAPAPTKRRKSKAPQPRSWA